MTDHAILNSAILLSAIMLAVVLGVGAHEFMATASAFPSHVRGGG